MPCPGSAMMVMFLVKKVAKIDRYFKGTHISGASISSHLKMRTCRCSLRRFNSNCTHPTPYQSAPLPSHHMKVCFDWCESALNGQKTVKETGWGEFDVEIRIYISDSSNKCVSVSHPLKLFQQRSEWYDEIIFVNPNPILAGLLTNMLAFKQGGWSHETDFAAIEANTLTSMEAASEKCGELIEEQLAVLEKKRNQIAILKEHIAKAN